MIRAMEEHPQPALTPTERAHTAARIMHDAVLLEDGAVINGAGQLVISGAQYRELYTSNIFLPEFREFRNNSVDGLMIGYHKQMLNEFKNSLMHNIRDGGSGAPEEGLVSSGQPGVPPDISQFRSWAEQNQLAINFNLLEGEKSWGAHAVKHVHDDAISLIRQYHEDLSDLALGLFKDPKFRTGNKVHVLRNDSEGGQFFEEAGWTIETIMANGRLKLSSPDGQSTKSATLTLLQNWSRQATQGA